MPVTGYEIDARRPLAPSEKTKHTLGGLRRAVGSGGLGAAIGAGLGHYTGAGAGAGAAVGGGLGILHGALKNEEAAAGDRTTQERMEMRKAMTAHQKAKKSSLDPLVLRSMVLEFQKVADAGAMFAAGKMPSLADFQASSGKGTYTPGVGFHAPQAPKTQQGHALLGTAPTMAQPAASASASRATVGARPSRQAATKAAKKATQAPPARVAAGVHVPNEAIARKVVGHAPPAMVPHAPPAMIKKPGTLVGALKGKGKYIGAAAGALGVGALAAGAYKAHKARKNRQVIQ